MLSWDVIPFAVLLLASLSRGPCARPHGGAHIRNCDSCNCTRWAAISFFFLECLNSRCVCSYVIDYFLDKNKGLLRIQCLHHHSREHANKRTLWSSRQIRILRSIIFLFASVLTIASYVNKIYVQDVYLLICRISSMHTKASFTNTYVMILF